VVPSGAEELEHGDPAEVARTNARRKALHVAAGHPDRLVLGVDTVVALDGEVFGKPDDAAHAARTLQRLQGRSHRVVSGLCLVRAQAVEDGVAVTEVTFRELDDEAVERYVATGEWQGRAGGYAIQERGAALVRSLAGDYLNVVGLPVALLLDLAPDLR
jgi:septum formation protein